MGRFVEVCQGVNARRDLMPEMALGRVFSHSQPDLRPSPLSGRCGLAIDLVGLFFMSRGGGTPTGGTRGLQPTGASVRRCRAKCAPIRDAADRKIMLAEEFTPAVRKGLLLLKK
jgi:hypothetical protein